MTVNLSSFSKIFLCIRVREKESLVFIMRVLAVAIIVQAFLVRLPFALGKVDHYKMAITENGKRFVQEIDVDEREEIEVFRVPSHNDVERATFYHDFKMRLTVTRMLSRKVCYLATMNPTMSSPGKLKADFQRTASHPGPLPVQTESSLFTVTGLANKLLLTKEILDFCGALPIYQTELYTGTSNENGTAIIRRTRQKRDFYISKFLSCLASEKPPQDHYKYVKNCRNAPFWNLECKMKRHACYYWVECHKTQKQIVLDWQCKTVHASQTHPSCCDYVCPPGY